MIFSLAQDFHDAVAAMPREHPKHRILELLEEAIRRDIHFIDRHPTTLFQCMWNTCWWYDCPEAAQHYEEPDRGWPEPPAWNRLGVRLCGILENWRNGREKSIPEFRWLRSARPPALNLGTAQHMVLRGHTGGVDAAVFSSDGSRIASVSRDYTVRVWDAVTGEEVLCFGSSVRSLGTLACPNSAAFSPDGTKLVSAWGTGKIYRCDAKTEGDVTTLSDGHESVTSVCFSADGVLVLSASSDKTVRVRRGDTGQEVLCIRGHENRVSCAVFSPDNARIASASADRTVRVWQAATGAQLLCLRSQSGVVDVAFSPDGARLAGAGSDGTVRVWDSVTGTELLCLRGDGHEAQSASFSPDGRRILGVAPDMFSPERNTIHVWDAVTGRALLRLKGHDAVITSAVFSSDGARIMSTSLDKTIRLWDASDRCEEPRRLRGHDAGVTKIAFSPTRAHIVTTSGYVREAKSSVASIWDLSTGRELFSFPGQGELLTDAVFSPDGLHVLTMGCAASVSNKGLFYMSVALSGGCVVDTATDSTVRVWDMVTGRQRLCLRGHKGHVVSAVVSSDGKRILTASRDMTVRMWDADTGQEILCLRGHAGAVLDAVFAPDHHRLVSASADKTVRLWDADTGAEVRCLRGHENLVRGAAFSPNGARIASVSGDDVMAQDNTIRVWDSATGKQLLCLKGHRAPVTHAVFTQDGARIVSAANDGAVRVWDANTGDCQEVVTGSDDVMSVAAECEHLPLRALVRGVETVLELAGTAQLVAWYPAEFSPAALRRDTRRAGGRTWAGAAAKYLHIFTLEGGHDT